MTEQARGHFAAVIGAVVAMAVYVAVLIGITPKIDALYAPGHVVYAPTHFNDARQYALICVQGYNLPYAPLPTLGTSRLNWMPVYPLAICALNRLMGTSIVYAGAVISALCAGFAVYFCARTLVNLGVQRPVLHAFAALIPPIGGLWLYLPGAEAIYLVVGAAVMWLITLPAASDTPDGNLTALIRTGGGLALGAVFVLTKPNALAMIAPLAFAFLYQSWQESRRAGYTWGLFAFTADVVIEHVWGAVRLVTRVRPPSPRPIRYVWTAAGVVAGILLGFTYWLAYSSRYSGVPFYFLGQQLNAWGRAWPSGNIGEMLTYYAQAFRGIDPYGRPWRFVSAWYLAPYVAALIPAASPRVPGLLRGMLPLLAVFVIYSGAVHGSDRYILSTALVALGWACWLAPTGKRRRWAALRWLFLILIAGITFYMLGWQMFPRGEPSAWGIWER